MPTHVQRASCACATRVADLLNANSAATAHDPSVTSVSLDQAAPRHLRAVQAGALDLDLFQAWISELVQVCAPHHDRHPLVSRAPVRACPSCVRLAMTARRPGV